MARTFIPHVEVEGIALVLATGEGCGPCRVFAPVYEDAAGRNPDVAFGVVRAEDDPAFLEALSVVSLPTLMVFRGGTLVLSRAGGLPSATLQGVIDKVRGLDMSKVGIAA